MKQSRFIIYAVVFIGLIGCQTHQDSPIIFLSNNNQPPTFQWTQIHIQKDSIPDQWDKNDVEVKGAGDYFINDSLISILPIDTGIISISYKEHTLELNARNNPIIDSSWFTLDKGSLPTPLTGAEANVWMNFSQYRNIGKKAPWIEVFIRSGLSTFSSDNFIDKVTFLNFWHIGCQPCLAEIPALKALSEKWASSPQVQFVSVCLDSVYVHQDSVFAVSRNSSIREKYLVENGFLNAGNGKEAAQEFGLKAYPTNYLIDKNGIIQKIMIGANRDEDKNIHLFDKMDLAIKELVN